MGAVHRMQGRAYHEMDLVGDLNVMSLEFVEACPRSWSRGIPSRVGLQTLDRVDVTPLLAVTQRPPIMPGVSEFHDRWRGQHTIPCARGGAGMNRGAKQRVRQHVRRESRR
jgi:hypothetical protein